MNASPLSTNALADAWSMAIFAAALGDLGGAAVWLSLLYWTQRWRSYVGPTAGCSTIHSRGEVHPKQEQDNVALAERRHPEHDEMVRYKTASRIHRKADMVLSFPLHRARVKAFLKFDSLSPRLRPVARAAVDPKG